MSDTGKPSVVAAVPALAADPRTMLSATANVKAVIKEIVARIQRDMAMTPDMAKDLLRGLKGDTNGVNPLVVEAD